MDQNTYHDKLTEHLRNMNNIMYTFEITKCCGYSTFITLYKTETLFNLYSRILEHFDTIDIKDLFFYAPSGQRIRVPFSKTLISQFIQDHVTCKPIRLIPVYNLPSPVVYRLYMDDGHCNEGRCNEGRCNEGRCNEGRCNEGRCNEGRCSNIVCSNSNNNTDTHNL
jgi:hypothetical protein